MKKIISFFTGLRFRQIMGAFLAGVLLLVTTACNNARPTVGSTPDQSQAMNKSGSRVGAAAEKTRPEVPGGAVTNEYQGGMNEFSDVDPRRDTSRAETKAKGLKDTVERNISNKSVDSLDQYAENYREGTSLGARVKNIAEDVAGSTGEVTKDVAKGTAKGAENVKANTQEAGQKVANQADRATTQADNLSKTAKRNAKDAADDLSKTAKRSVEDAADAVTGNRA